MTSDIVEIAVGVEICHRAAVSVDFLPELTVSFEFPSATVASVRFFVDAAVSVNIRNVFRCRQRKRRDDLDVRDAEDRPDARWPVGDDGDTFRRSVLRRIHEDEKDDHPIAAETDEDVPEEVRPGKAKSEPGAAGKPVAEPYTDGDEPRDQALPGNGCGVFIAAAAVKRSSIILGHWSCYVTLWFIIIDLLRHFIVRPKACYVT